MPASPTSAASTRSSIGIERLPIATIAEVDGAAAGGGCAIAMACDLRICSDRARFGVPVARTLGNCLSIGNTARLVDLRRPRARRATCC